MLVPVCRVLGRGLDTLPALCLIAVLVGSSKVHASTLFESLLADKAVNTSFLRGQSSVFDPSLDFVDYLGSLPEGATPNRYERSELRLGYSGKSWRPFVEYGKILGSVKRSTQPKEVSSNANFAAAGLTYLTGDGDDGFSYSLTVSRAKQDTVTIDCYERSGVTLGGACSEADFQLIDGDQFLETGEQVAFPVVTSGSKATSVELTYDRWQANPKGYLLMGHSFKFKGSEVEHRNDSPLYDLESQALLNTPFGGQSLGSIITDLREDLPQGDPWRELVVRYDFSASYFFNNWVAAGSLGALYAKRFDYRDPLGRKQYNTNVTASAEIWYQMTAASVFLKAEAFSNYLLGVDPLAYTNKTSRFFEHPYGQLSAGFIVTF